MLQVLTLPQWINQNQRMIAKANNLAPLLKRAAVVVRSAVVQRFTNGTDPAGNLWQPLAHPRIRGGSKPLLDTGALRASITGSSSGNTLTVGTNHPSANLHNFGGVVVPKNAKYLAIPISREAQRAGSPRNFPRRLWFRFRSPDRGIMAETRGQGRRQRVVVHYILRDKVTIPQREFIGWGPELAIVESMILQYITS